MIVALLLNAFLAGLFINLARGEPDTLSRTCLEIASGAAGTTAAICVVVQAAVLLS